MALEVVAELVPLEPSSAGGAGALGGPSGLFCEVSPATIRNILLKRIVKDDLWKACLQYCLLCDLALKLLLMIP